MNSDTVEWEDKKIYSVYELTSAIKQNLEVGFTGIWVQGEVSNLRRPSSGHIYFTLKDEKAELKAVMFRYLNQRLKFKLEDGLQIIIYGGLTVYEKRGEYQISAVEIEPKGFGALQLAFEQLKKRLEKEGLFEVSHKKSIPVLPRKIGVVTSPSGAAIQDIIHVLRQRYSHVNIILNPVRVQGEGAAEEISQAIDELNEMNDLDVIIVGRGGGTAEDLWAFNEEIVARSIYNSKIPVISAVGHEIDYTISDFVADLRAATPSHAAELVVKRQDDLESQIEYQTYRLASLIKNKFDFLKNSLFLAQQSYSLRLPHKLITQFSQRADDLTEEARINISEILKVLKENLRVYMEKLNALSPLEVLSRGYSLALKLPQKEVIRDADIVKKDDLVEVVVYKGKFLSKVI